MVNPAGAGDDAADAPLRLQREYRGECFVRAVNLVGVDAGKGKFGAGARLVAEGSVLRAAVLE
jgi:hypothetical protein